MVNGKIIKVCGMREAENIQEIESLQDIDMLGFIFYPKSPRYVYELPAYLPIHTHRVGVFVNEDKQIVSMYADRFGLNYVQLHGNESPEYCRSLYSMGIKIIKAFSISHPKDLKNVYKYEKVCDLFLFDTKCEQYGGSGIYHFSSFKNVRIRTGSFLRRHQLLQRQRTKGVQTSTSRRLRPEQPF